MTMRERERAYIYLSLPFPLQCPRARCHFPRRSVTVGTSKTKMVSPHTVPWPTKCLMQAFPKGHSWQSAPCHNMLLLCFHCANKTFPNVRLKDEESLSVSYSTRQVTSCQFYKGKVEYFTMNLQTLIPNKTS